MTTVALIHPDHGTHFVFDSSEVQRHLKLGWKVRADNWKEVKLAADLERKKAAMKAEQARLTAELAELDAPKPEVVPAVDMHDSEPKKRGRPAKAR